MKKEEREELKHTWLWEDDDSDVFCTQCHVSWDAIYLHDGVDPNEQLCPELARCPDLVKDNMTQQEFLDLLSKKTNERFKQFEICIKTIDSICIEDGSDYDKQIYPYLVKKIMKYSMNADDVFLDSLMQKCALNGSEEYPIFNNPKFDFTHLAKAMCDSIDTDIVTMKKITNEYVVNAKSK